MKTLIALVVAAVICWLPYGLAQPQPEIAETLDPSASIQLDANLIETAQLLIGQAQQSPLAWQIVESLTTEVGPRLGGSEAEARAREWGFELGNSLNFDLVSVEEFSMQFWRRGELQIDLQAPYEQALYGTALGGAAPSNGALNADVVYFRSIDDLIKVADNEIAGQIAFVDGNPLIKTQTGEGYVTANLRRTIGWQHAERGGAKALVVRSVGSSSHRFPHTGMMRHDDKTWPDIPVLAISNPDADHLRRLHQLGEEIRLTINSGSAWQEEVTSGNVILDLIGREKPEEIVLIGAHLDSWDLGTGAIDDGAGIAITTAAAELIAALPQRPRRTIRVVMFGAEEVGLLGAKAYAAQHAEEINNHVLATESDFGADRIWQLVSNVNPQATPAIDAIGKLLLPLGILRGGDKVVGGGPDIIPLAKLGVPTVRLNKHGLDYFDLHHTPNDTLDKVDPQKLAQNVAAYAALTYLVAELDVEFRSPDLERPKVDI